MNWNDLNLNKTKQLKNLFLKEVSLDRLNGVNSNDLKLNGASSSPVSPGSVNVLNQNTPSSMEFLRIELNHREDIINSLQQELKSMRSQYESLLSKVTFCFRFFFLTLNPFTKRFIYKRLPRRSQLWKG